MEEILAGRVKRQTGRYNQQIIKKGRKKKKGIPTDNRIKTRTKKKRIKENNKKCKNKETLNTTMAISNCFFSHTSENPRGFSVWGVLAKLSAKPRNSS